MANANPEEQAKVKAAETAQIAACKAALEPLANIMAPDETAGEKRRINRCGNQAVITDAHIEEARKVRAKPTATLKECREALKPLASLPTDFRVEDKTAPLYKFKGLDGAMFPISIHDIETARQLSQG